LQQGQFLRCGEYRSWFCNYCDW